mmetsp:Transcript_20739/g.60608  ORF Transcript_20739/g.60608 Transcript_20739/m.60608 type:complete len:113 (-) Transcript_20739:322-660(-)
MADQVGCYHLLLKHTGSRNPVSRRTGKAITISKEQALEELDGFKAKITPENFQELAAERSDCGSFREGGDLGMFGRGMMQAPFEEAAFALEVGQISDVVDSDSGVHLILRYA